MINKIKNRIIYIVAKYYYSRRYDAQYLTGRWFTEKYEGTGALGWRWVINCSRNSRKLGVNKNIPWPVSYSVRVLCPHNVVFDPDNLDNFQSPGCYFQAVNKISIGKGTYIGPNVGIITANHDFTNLDTHTEGKPVKIGRNCWIGMNAVILPGVTLGDNTIVGAGAIVNRSFDGSVVVAGNPAKIVKVLK